MCYIDKSDSQPVMHSLELYLHLFSHLEIQCAKRLIQKKYLWLIDKSSRYSYSLLLSTRKRGDFSVLKALKSLVNKDEADPDEDSGQGSIFSHSSISWKYPSKDPASATLQGADSLRSRVDNIKNFRKYFISALYNEVLTYHFNEGCESRWADNAVAEMYGRAV